MPRKETKKKSPKDNKKLPKNVRERNGLYYYRYSIKNPATGKRKQKESQGFATAKEAEKEGIRIQAEILHGTYVEKAGLTVSDWCKEWLRWYSSTGQVKESTVAQRTEMTEILINYIGGLKLHEVTEDTYQETLYTLANDHDDPYSYNSISSFHSCARMIFSRALQKGKIKVDPTQYAFVPKKVETFEEREAAKKLPRYLEKDELRRFLNAVEGEQFRRLFELLAYTGLRVGELAALFVTDYDGRDILEISKNRYAPRSVRTYKLTSPKTKSSDRVVQLSKKAISVIEGQIKWRRAFAFSIGEKFYNERQFLFVCEKACAGYPLHYNIILERMKEALANANLPTSLAPHSLRHTYTSLMAEAGADLDTIQAQLGHRKGSDVTKAIYLHVTKAREKRDVERLDALLDALE
ncbi:tyrosine-type recombinase/integrase [Paenibacillus flagellatus]|uniref:Site-specific integrase n=1 Tax=Paenibacillus flagellatus TaxID=2211139 RepID=A0A2V5KC53_9BACL|nr:tyrosine-type recombinase/integrase [Paenibacillus flagellatus]PYI57058.1 site-specific integrase [Paenibacillus flagellatus]